MSVVYHVEKQPTARPTQKPAGEVRHPCDYVSTGDVDTIADGNWSSSGRTRARSRRASSTIPAAG